LAIVATRLGDAIPLPRTTGAGTFAFTIGVPAAFSSQFRQA
jgi:hypothetical protein